MKKSVKILLTVIIIIGLIIIGAIGSNVILDNRKIEETAEKISLIDAEELETKIIEELEDSAFYIEYSSGYTKILTNFSTKGKDDNLVYGAIGGTIDKKDLNMSVADDFIIFRVAIPCFEIESDSNGKLKNITYLKSDDPNTVEYIVAEAVEDVFMDEYGIDTEVDGYNGKFDIYDKKQKFEIISTGDGFTENIVRLITEKDYYEEPDMYTRTFGVDIEK